VKAAASDAKVRRSKCPKTSSFISNASDAKVRMNTLSFAVVPHFSCRLSPRSLRRNAATGLYRAEFYGFEFLLFETLSDIIIFWQTLQAFSTLKYRISSLA